MSWSGMNIPVRDASPSREQRFNRSLLGRIPRWPDAVYVRKMKRAAVEGPRTARTSDIARNRGDLIATIREES